MSAKFMFDECLGLPAMDKLKQLVPDTPHFDHVCNYFQSGILDKDWIPKLGQEGDWIVITGDRGKGAKRGGKLPELCKQHKITHVLLSKTLHQKKSDEKVAALALVWNEIAQLSKEPPGSQFVLRLKESKGRSGYRIHLEKR